MRVFRHAVVAAILFHSFLSHAATDGAIETTDKSSAVQWKPLLEQSAYFLTLKHGFRLATEPGTRSGVQGPFFKNYFHSVASLRGWSDGDPGIVNYVGHPMQGAVTGFLFTQNDFRYRNVQFGSSRAYWKSRLRATAFSWVYSTQFEIGPFSEASVGAVQSHWPQHGFVDHVVTPTFGLGWQITEDALDRFVIQKIENKFENKFVRMMARGWLNPSRSFANILRGEVPWHRDTRPGVSSYRSGTGYIQPDDEPAAEGGLPTVEFMPMVQFLSFGGGQCLGGGAQAGFRLNPNWYAVGSVTGCGISDLGPGVSADSLQYMVGLQWKARPQAKWSPHLQFLLGGARTSREVMDEEKRRQIHKDWQGRHEPMPYDQFASRTESNGLALAAGGGLDYRLTRALSFRVAGIEYNRSFARELEGVKLQEGLRASMGVVLNMGNW